MKVKNLGLAIAIIAFSCQSEKVAMKDYTEFVNPLIGTDGTGHTFPGPSMPFGLVQPGPDNKNTGWSHTSGYQYQDTVLMGFSQTRLNGTGINELGDVLLMPGVKGAPDSKIHSYSKATEIAQVGYYSLTKNDAIKVELTCSERVAMHRYSFPENKEAQVYVNSHHGLIFGTDENVKDGLIVDSNFEIINDSTIVGFSHTKNWVRRKYFFVINFDTPFERSMSERQNGAFTLDFGKLGQRALKVKIALSTVSEEGAIRNLKKEIPDWDFERVREENVNSWNAYLSRIDIEAGIEQKEIFYSSLYRLFLQPSNIADVDGQYRGVDDVVQKATNGNYYSTLSIWDIYRGAWPLLQILAPEKVDGIVQSMLEHHEAAGFLPIWTVWGQDNYCMIGNHAIPMILSAYTNGFRGFDPQMALKAMIETSTQSHINSDWELYNQYGYYPLDKLDNEAVSRTLESGYDDWAVADMATRLGDLETARIFRNRSKYYKNLFDPDNKLFRGKDTEGKWRLPFDPLTATSPLNNPGDYTEANAWQYFWTPAQYDIIGTKELLGGDRAFTDKLNQFFEIESKNPNKFLGQEAMIGQYAHGNEPSHHIAYLYAYSLEPKTGQKYITQIIRDFHKNTPDGMIGNDDCGQMSAWYIMSTLGFYPINPANGEFVLGVPQVASANIRLPGGKTFKIKSRGYSAEKRFRSKVALDNRRITEPYITFSQIVRGGVMEFYMEKE